MSAIQSKAKGPSGKRTAYYGRLSGGSMSCRSSELTRDDVITPARLRAFSPSDFEANVWKMKREMLSPRYTTCPFL